MDKKYSFMDDRVDSVLSILKVLANVCLFLLATLGLFFPQYDTMSNMTNIWFIVWTMCLYNLIDNR
jgi:hypothetical protein